MPVYSRFPYAAVTAAEEYLQRVRRIQNIVKLSLLPPIRVRFLLKQKFFVFDSREFRVHQFRAVKEKAAAAVAPRAPLHKFYTHTHIGTNCWKTDAEWRTYSGAI